MAGLFSTAEGTFYKWKREQRPIISLLEKYFTKEELEEFLRTGGIEKMEIVAGLSLEDLKLIRENKEVIIKFQEIKQLLQGTNNV
jgi:hypothetical protein